VQAVAVRGGETGCGKTSAAGAERALAALYRAEAGRLRAYLARLLKSEADADDVVQEAFLRLHRRGDLEGYEKPVSVLFRTGHRLALNRMRSRRRSLIDRAAPMMEEAAAPPAPAATAEEALIAREQETAYADALAALPPRCRQVIELRTVHELSFRQMSDSLGLSISTLEKHLVRGKRACAEVLATWNGAGRTGRPAYEPPRAVAA
jgi:RNA polymerase sigma-70 factor (ECF subfamily)